MIQLSRPTYCDEADLVPIAMRDCAPMGIFPQSSEAQAFAQATTMELNDRDAFCAASNGAVAYPHEWTLGWVQAIGFSHPCADTTAGKIS